MPIKLKVVCLLAMMGSFLVAPTLCFAIPVCSTPPDCEVWESSGNIGGEFTINYLGSTDLRFDTIIFRSLNDHKIYVGDDSSITSIPYRIWKHVYFGDASLTQNMNVKFFGSNLTFSKFKLDAGLPWTVQTSQLNLNHVDLETDIKLLFAGSDNQINLSNSGIYFASQQPEFHAQSTLIINVLQGDNYLKAFHGQHRHLSTIINLQPGTSLLFDHSGSLGPFANIPDKLYFSTPVTGNVNNATLKFHYSNVYFNSTAFNFTNNSALELTGSDTKVEFENVSFDTSQMTLGNNTTLTASNLYLDNATIDLESGAKVNADFVYVTGPTTLAGPGGNKAGINTIGFFLSDGITFTQNSSRVTVSSDFFLRPGSVLNINGVGTRFSAKTTSGYGGTVNISTGGEFVVAGGFVLANRDATFNIGAGSYLRVASNAEVSLVPSLVINNDGLMTLDGYLSGNGTIGGSGAFRVAESGQITPGNAFGNKINTITFENAVVFDNVALGGNQTNQNQYYAHIDVVGGTATNDLLQYDDNDFNITGLTSIKVNTASAKTADELDRKSFTIVSSLDSGSTGNLIMGSSYPAIVEGGDVPALIDFTISNNGTNGNDDVTLLAEKDYDHLAKHPSVTSKNHKAGVSLLINSANSGNAATMSALNSLTNSQVASHVESIHPEPYSSYMTISLEHSDMVMNTVLNHAASSGHVSTGHTGEAEEKQTGKHFWMEASYNEGDVNGDGALGDFDYNLSSLTVGQDLVASDDRALGIYFSFGTQEMDEHDNAIQDFDGDVYHLGMYLNQANVGSWDLRGVLGYAYGDHSSKRQVILSNTSASPSADYDSHSAYLGMKATVTGYQNDWVTLSPEIGFNYIYYTQDSFKESGDPALSLKIDSADAHAVIASAGLNGRFASLSETISIYPLAFARYEHDFYANANNEHEIDAALVAHPDYKQTFVGQSRGEHALITGLGLGSDLTSALQINGGFVHSENSHGREWGAGLNLEYLW